MSSVLTLGAQEGPQHRDRGEEEVAAAQAAAGAVAGEDGLGLVHGLICGDTGRQPGRTGLGTLEGLGLGEGLGWDSATPSSLGHSWSQGQGEGTWVLPRSLHTKDTHWLDARKLSVAGRGGPPGWEVWQLEERTTFWGLHAPFSTLLTQPIKLLTMCQNLRHNALGFLGVSSMFPLSRLTPKAE